MSATDRDDQAGQWVSGYMGRVWRPDAEKALKLDADGDSDKPDAKRLDIDYISSRFNILEGCVAKLSLRLEAVENATGAAITQLLEIQAGAAPDCNAALWEYFDQLGGDCDRLRQQIEMFKQLKSLSQTGGEA